MKKNLSIENCCDQLKAILKLKRLMKLRTLEESDDYYPEVKRRMRKTVEHKITDESTCNVLYTSYGRKLRTYLDNLSSCVPVKGLDVGLMCSRPFTGRHGPNQLTYSQLCGFIAQLVKDCTAEVMGSNPIEAT